MPLILVVDDSPTIRKVVSHMLEDSGFDVALATDGQDALDVMKSGEVKPDLVLLDFVMPRMNGFQFSRALHKEKTLTATPVVLMSAKAERIREQFVQQTGAIDAITKPFGRDALVAVVETALRRVEDGKKSATKLPGTDEIDSVPPLSLDLGLKEVKVARAVAAHVMAACGDDIAGKPRGELETHLAAGLTKEVLVAIHGELNPVLPRILRMAQLSGDLSIIPIGSILQMLQVEGQSGRLTCVQDDREITAAVRGGLLDIVVSKGLSNEFRIGRYFVGSGLFTAQEIEDLAQTDKIPPMPELSDVDLTAVAEGPPTEAVPGSPASSAPKTEEIPTAVYEEPNEDTTVRKQTGRLPLGLRLLAAGKIDEHILRAALTQQSSELVDEVLRWRRGRFVFHRQIPDMIADRARLGLHIAQVAMEGFRRIDQWPLLEATLGSLDAVWARDENVFAAAADAHDLTESVVAESIDGKRTVSEIVRHSHLASFDVCRVLAQFVQGGLVRRILA
jgi:DNA-binding response OmpR family regulator